MSVTLQVPYRKYIAAAAASVFATSFRVIVATDLIVKVNGSVVTSGFTLSGLDSPAGVDVTFTTPMTGGEVIELQRSVSLTRATDYQQLGDFLSPVVNADFDRIVMMLQDQDYLTGQFVQLPDGDATAPMVLPAASSRLDRLFAFNATTGALEMSPFTVSQVLAAVGAAYAAGSTADAVAFSYAVNYAVGTIGWSAARSNFGIDVSQAPYNADNTGATSCHAAIAAAWAAFPGVPLRFPRGTYRIDSTVTLHTSAFNYNGVFGPGAKIFGDGVGVTIFDNRVSGGAMFDIDSDTGDAHASFKAPLGIALEGFTVKTGGSPTTSTAIKLRTAYMASIRQLHIAGMSAHGIEVVCTVGDNDGSNMVNIEQVRIDACAGWGIKSDAASGHNETSYVAMRQVSINGCGTASASATPPSGGMIWKGQVVTAQQCSFVTCENVGLFIPGQAGLGQVVDMVNVTFENNKKRGFYSTGVQGLRGKLLQFYNNDGYTATNAFEVDGASYTVRNVELDGVIVRATSGNNAYTAFKISGGNAVLESCRVRRVTWDNFDHAGQTRFDGWQFDHVEAGCDLVAEDPTTLTLRPSASRPVRSNKMPYRLRGGIGGTPSTSGEIIDLEIPASGISVTPSGLPASALRYYCYLYDNNGLPSLELSTTGFVTSSIGYSVKSGDATRIYVGSVETDATPQFKLTAGGWLNPNWIPASQVGVFNAQWCDSTGDLRVKTDGSAPTSDTDGVIVGTQS